MPSERQSELIARARGLIATLRVRNQVEGSEGRFPSENFRDLASAGLLATTVPKEHGGEGWSVEAPGFLAQWQLTATIAQGDMSTARIYEAHVNNIEVIARFAPPSLRARILGGAARGEVLLSGWAVEPDSVDTRGGRAGNPARTTARRGDGGWILDGVKIYASGAGGSTHALVTAEPVDERSRDPLARQHWFLIDTADPGLSIDETWWRPLGMRSSASHRVVLRNLFVPDEHRITNNAELARIPWIPRTIPHFVASFLGGAAAAHEVALAYARERGLGEDPHVSHHIAHMRIALDTGFAFLAATARAWEEGSAAEASQRSNICRIVGERQATEVLTHALQVCGASALIAPRPLERICRDLTLYLRHGNSDSLLTAIGQAELRMPESQVRD